MPCQPDYWLDDSFSGSVTTASWCAWKQADKPTVAATTTAIAISLRISQSPEFVSLIKKSHSNHSAAVKLCDSGNTQSFFLDGFWVAFRARSEESSGPKAEQLSKSPESPSSAPDLSPSGSMVRVPIEWVVAPIGCWHTCLKVSTEGP